MAKKKIDPLNKKAYIAVSAALTVADIPAAVSSYQKAFGFAKRAIMNGADGKPMHAELTSRGTVLMLAPESAAMGRRTAKSIEPLPLPSTYKWRTWSDGLSVQSQSSKGFINNS